MKKKRLIFILVIAVIIALSIVAYKSYNVINNPETSFRNSEAPKSSSDIDTAKKYKSEFNADKIYLAFLGLDMTDERIKTIGNFMTDTIGIFLIDLKTKK
jgi:hypothetical protein